MTSETSPLRLERRDGGLAVLWFDVPGEKVNTLQAGFDRDFAGALDALEADRGIVAAVLASGKPDDFVAGADLRLLRSVTRADEAEALSRRAQAVMDRIEACRVPVVAAIHGACLGGGLELALACRGRVASDSERTKFAAPEVRLGVLPGAGGTQRLPRLVGPAAALDLMLTGRNVAPKRALAMGLVDVVVPPPLLLDAALAHARALAEGKWTRPPRRRGLATRLLESNPLGRALLFGGARRRVLAETHGNMPAPLRIVDLVRAGRGNDAEAAAFGALAVTPQARNLMDLFFAVNDLKKDPGADLAAAREVPKIAVLGAGLMGAGIAHVTAEIARRPVRMKDVGHDALRRGLAAIHGALDAKVRRGRLTAAERDRILDRVRPATDYTGFRRAAVVIEAVVEDLAVKRAVLREVEANGAPDAIFASNTSSIPIDRIADGAADPSRVVGMHYFSPVDKMPLLEVIAGPRTAPWAVATCVKLGQAQGKTVIVVRDGAGFYTTRILGPYVAEAGHLLGEGVPVEAIDRALARFGFPIGPVKLLDEVGLDTGHKIGQVLHEAFGERMAPAPALEKIFADGRRGRKNGRGFYRYGAGGRGGGARGVDPTVYAVIGVRPEARMAEQEIVSRCVLAMVNEAHRCLAEGILQSPRDGDIGAVMGLGFPPFRGGPFRYVEDAGREAVRTKLREYEQRFGPRFAPAV